MWGLSVLPYRELLEQAVLLEGVTEESSFEVLQSFYRAFDLAFQIFVHHE